MQDQPELLFDLSSGDCQLTIKVLGRFGLGVPGPHDDLEVEFVANAGPFGLSTSDVLSRFELSELASCLDRAAEGETSRWRDSGRTMLVVFEPDADGVRVTVVDETSSGAELMLPFQLGGVDWTSDQRTRLQRVEARYPAESVQSGSGVWTWKPR